MSPDLDFWSGLGYIVGVGCRSSELDELNVPASTVSPSDLSPDGVTPLISVFS